MNESYDFRNCIENQLLIFEIKEPPDGINAFDSSALTSKQNAAKRRNEENVVANDSRNEMHTQNTSNFIRVSCISRSSSSSSFTHLYVMPKAFFNMPGRECVLTTEMHVVGDYKITIINGFLPFRRFSMFPSLSLLLCIHVFVFVLFFSFWFISPNVRVLSSSNLHYSSHLSLSFLYNFFVLMYVPFSHFALSRPCAITRQRKTLGVLSLLHHREIFEEESRPLLTKQHNTKSIERDIINAI